MLSPEYHLQKNNKGQKDKNPDTSISSAVFNRYWTKMTDIRSQNFFCKEPLSFLGHTVSATATWCCVHKHHKQYRKQGAGLDPTELY